MAEKELLPLLVRRRMTTALAWQDGVGWTLLSVCACFILSFIPKVRYIDTVVVRSLCEWRDASGAQGREQTQSVREHRAHHAVQDHAAWCCTCLSLT